MAEIQVMPLGEGKFRVTVAEGSATNHTVSVLQTTLDQLNWSGTPEALIRASFEFLLQREPKESILGEFEILDIARYFPEFEEKARGGFG
ncbi:MAG: hypothetical protein ACRDI1_05985 [Actinomycetota bacterium]